MVDKGPACFILGFYSYLKIAKIQLILYKCEGIMVETLHCVLLGNDAV